MKERRHTLIGEGINEAIRDCLWVDFHKIINKEKDLLMILNYGIKVVKLELFLPLELNHIVDNVPVLLHKIAFVDKVSAEWEPCCKCFHPSIFLPDACQDNVAAGCANQTFRVIVESGCLHQKGE